MARLHSGISDQRKAALRRKADARALLESGPQHTRGAMYLGGYAIECKVKAIAMEIHSCRTLEALRERLNVDEREVYTHGLESLLGRLVPTGLLDRLKRGVAGRAFASYVNAWRPSWRYDPTNATMEKARAFLDAVDAVYTWLDSNRA